jgi:mRNA interferase MazF
LIIQADDLRTGLSQTIVAMISSNLTRAGHACRVLVKQASEEGQQMGLHSDSAVMTDNIATLLENEIDRKIGYCGNMQSVDSAIRITLGL